ncbi:hypothetical protein PL78_05390 [Yersinia entomophaga]|uniref:Uncharacterized protein n=1 Tax=Yersinia entomophaga TaxID=935293 RepID=A0ABM6BI93_YERET|nr:hypothetical protein PL78_05390 [Yersinia entomophaga]OWF89126.1 hypothetical protein B4914_04370 [Yersinia entomophaga]
MTAYVNYFTLIFNQTTLKNIGSILLTESGILPLWHAFPCSLFTDIPASLKHHHIYQKVKPVRAEFSE